MQNGASIASACLLIGSLCVGAMGLLWSGLLVVGLVAGAAGLGGTALATALGVEIPPEVVATGNVLVWGYLGIMLMMALVATANLVGGGFGLFSAVRGFSGRTWGLRLAAGAHILMALVFGLPGAVTMNPMALVWAVVLVLGIVTLVAAPRAVTKGPALD